MKNWSQYSQWALIVGLNTCVGFIFGALAATGFSNWVGMILGVVTWYFLYVFVDSRLLKAGKNHSSRKLKLCAILRIPIQLTYYPDFYAVLLAAGTLEHWDSGNSVTYFYATTVLTGLYLSIMCAVIYGVLTLILKPPQEPVES